MGLKMKKSDEEYCNWCGVRLYGESENWLFAQCDICYKLLCEECADESIINGYMICGDCYQD